MPQYFGKLPITTQAWSTLGTVQSFEQNERGICIDCGGPRLLISVLTPNLVRVRLAPTGEFFPRRSWAVAQDDDQWELVPIAIEEGEEAIVLKTEQISVYIYRVPCRIVCFNQAGQAFAEDADLGMGWSASGVAAWKRIEADEHFYGFGERTGFLDKLAERKTNWTVDAVDFNSQTDEMYQAIPFFTALRPELSYGIFLNSSFWSQFDIGAHKYGIWQMVTRAPELDYYIIYGPEPAQILATYTELTGRMPLPPKWSLGYHQCRWSYESDAIVRELAQTFRERRIPAMWFIWILIICRAIACLPGIKNGSLIPKHC